MNNALAERIRSRLDDLEMSAAELARRARVKPPSVALWLDGTTKSIKGENLLLAAQALQVTPDWLATGKGPKFPGSTHQAAEPSPAYGDGSIAEAIGLLEQMNPKARQEALSFLRVFATKKGGSAPSGQRAHDHAAARRAA